ncbi:MAG: nucleotidyltransferase domain-containing protein [Acidobacteriota bacterium]|nr:nucleotidyltransferase domain-containing protein [Acidobacteriota bacterium]
MDTSAEIQKLCEQIARDFHPEQIILFGSHAYGTPTPDSDIDLLVVMPFEGRHTQQAIKIRSRIDTPLPLDLLVRTPEQISERLAMGDFFVREIIEMGKVVYEADYAGVDR